MAKECEERVLSIEEGEGMGWLDGIYEVLQGWEEQGDGEEVRVYESDREGYGGELEGSDWGQKKTMG